MTPGCNEDGKLLSNLGVIIEEFHESLAQLFLHLWNASLTGFIHDDRSACSISIRQNWTAEIVLLQDADGAETVEPGVGSFLIHLVDTFLLNTVIEGHPLVVEALCLQLLIPESTALHKLWAMLFCYKAVLVEAKRSNLGSNTGFQYISCFGCEAFDSICVHTLSFEHGFYLIIITPSWSTSSFSSCWRRPSK